MEVVPELFKIWVIVQDLGLAVGIVNEAEWLSLKLILFRRLLLGPIQKRSVVLILVRRFVGSLSRCFFVVIGGLLQKSVLRTLVDLAYDK